jgi:MFS family permease
MMTSIAASPDMVALVQASTTLPVMLFSLAAGAISDNYDRRKIMLTAQGFMLVVSIACSRSSPGSADHALAAADLHLPDRLRHGAEQPGLAVLGRRHGAAPRRAGRGDAEQRRLQHRPQRRARPSAAPSSRRPAPSPPSPSTRFSYIALIVVLARWQPPKVERLLPRETLWIAMGAGMRYVAMSPNIRSVILRAFAFGFGGIVVLALLPLIARDLVHGGPLTFGVLLGAFGAGAVGGAFMSARLRRMLTTEAWCG